MTIKFNCSRCSKEVKAPEEAGGKRGKCPYCGMSNYIPLPVSEDEILPLAPIDEEEEKLRQKEVQELLKQDLELLAASEEQAKSAQQQQVVGEDVSHYVVNYCLDMFGGNLKRAELHIEALKKHGLEGFQTVADFMNGKLKEDALKKIPPKVLQGFLAQLRDQVKQ